MIPQFPSKKKPINISRKSVVYNYYNRSELEKKKIIYDNITKTDNSIEYNVVTII